MVRYSESMRKSVTGNDLFTVKYLPDNSPRAALCFHHGIGEHVGRYKALFTTLADTHSIAVFSGDTVGHGKSTGTRAYVNSFSDLTTDFQALCDAASAELNSIYPDAAPLPLFLAGQSLGGLVVCMTCLAEPSRYAGILLSCPAIDVEWTPMLKVQAAVGNLLAAAIPKARIVPAVDPANLNKDPAKVKEYVEDPLNTVGAMPARTGNEALKAFRELAKRRGEVSVPVYAHHGTADKVTSMPATKAFVEGVSSTDATFLPIENGKHEVLFEDTGPAILTGMAEWILARSNGAATTASGAKL